MRSVSINTPGTATSATNRLETLDIPHFSAVAVPKNSATSSATTATKNHDMKGGKQHEANQSYRRDGCRERNNQT